jgi:hypothetical protein
MGYAICAGQAADKAAWIYHRVRQFFRYGPTNSAVDNWTSGNNRVTAIASVANSIMRIKPKLNFGARRNERTDGLRSASRDRR